ncbi:MAG: extracellular solute-binding protein [Alphaproteobacteria bacterium]
MKSPLSRRHALKAAATLGIGALASWVRVGTPRAQSREVIVSSWGGTFQDNLRKILFAPFTKETGIAVTEVTWGGQGLARLKAQLEAGRVEVDLLDGPPFWPGIGSKGGLLQPIDLSGIADRAAHVPAALGEFSYGYGAISWGIVASQKAFAKGGPKSWGDFWNAEAFRGQRALFGPLVARHVEYALMADGVAPDAVNPLDGQKVERAFAKLAGLKGKIAVWYQTTAQMETLLGNGEIDCGELTSTRAHFLQSQNLPLSFEYNQAVMNTLIWVMAKNAPNKANAEAFIRFCSRADRQAEFATLLFQGPTNTKALELIKDASVLERLPTHPGNASKQVVLDGAWWANNLEALAPRWNKLTSA